MSPRKGFTKANASLVFIHLPVFVFHWVDATVFAVKSLRKANALPASPSPYNDSLLNTLYAPPGVILAAKYAAARALPDFFLTAAAVPSIRFPKTSAADDGRASLLYDLKS